MARTVVTSVMDPREIATLGWSPTATGLVLTLDPARPNGLKWAAAAGGGGGAPTNASYVVLGPNGTLTNERVLTAGSGITITDAGAGSTGTVAASGGAGASRAQVAARLALGGF